MFTATPDLKISNDIDIYKIEFDQDINLCHIYMEAQIFTPDSKRFVLHSGTTPHGGNGLVPELHRYYLCDIENDCDLIQVTSEPQAIAPALSPDGKTMYYVLDHSLCQDDQRMGIELKAVSLESFKSETLLVIDGKLPGTDFYPDKVYSLSTISSDGKHLAIKLKLKNDFGENHAVLVFDLENGKSWIALLGNDWVNVHPQYCRSLSEENRYDLMVQQNHGIKYNENGQLERHHSGLGMDIHLIRDDGTNFRDMPWGRAPDEICHGHQCWVGRSLVAIEQCSQRPPYYQNGLACPAESPERAKRIPLIAGTAGEHKDHAGKFAPGSWRKDLCGSIEIPFFAHFATDINGNKIIADSCSLDFSKHPVDEWRYLYVADIPESFDDNEIKWKPIADSKSLEVNSKDNKLYGTAHAHPFLSPDGKMGFFNSNESGILRPYMIKFN